ncbi:MAG TPA: hypothetical protein VFW65_22165 [Pseudonocardiaceae bacterium]|nr:hypothetical protein [Pseudonocardiaceae bacterium]
MTIRTHRPQIPDSATWERKSIDDKGTMYAPTAIGRMTTATLSATCPMSYQVCPDATYVELGHPGTELVLTISDLALLDTAKRLNSAVHELRTTRRANPQP